MFEKKVILKNFENNLFWQATHIAGEGIQMIRQGEIGTDVKEGFQNHNTYDESIMNTLKTIRELESEGYIVERNDLTKNTKQIDYTSDTFWKKVADEFYKEGKRAINELVNKSYKSETLAFWVHVNYPPFFIYNNSVEVLELGEFNVPTLWEAYEKYETEEMPISFKDLEGKLSSTLSPVLKKMEKEGCFKDIYNNELRVEFGTVDEGFVEVFKSSQG